LAVEQDPLISQYGQGETHASNIPVERLVQLQIEKDEILRVDQAPIYLKILGFNIARNWEGVVMLDELGFLLITDSFSQNSTVGNSARSRVKIMLLITKNYNGGFCCAKISGRMVQ
jgi:hypothetical protein